jgi:hypothetical protein
MIEKTGSKINSWLIDESYLKSSCGISENDMEDFINTSNYVYKFFITCPIPLFISWDRLNKAYYISLGNKYCMIPFNPKISVYDFQELIDRWARRHYPGYSFEEEEQVEYTSEEIAELVQQGRDPDELFNSYKVQKVKHTFLIERLLIKDDQVYVKKDDKTFILIARPDKPISVFISNFRKIESDQERKVFLESFTKSVMEITHLKTIEIRYKTERMFHFFKIRGLSLHKEKFLKTDDPLVYRWSRFLITFSTRAEINEIKKIILDYRKNYSTEYENDILKKVYNVRFGENRKKSKNKETSDVL